MRIREIAAMPAETKQNDTAAPDRLIFVKRGKQTCARESAVIRIGEAQYKMLCELSADTKLSISGVAGRMLDFAAQHIEMVEAE